MKKTFTIIILFLSCADVFGDEVKSVSEGDSVTLHTDLTEIKTGDLVWWRFKKGDSKDLLAEIGKNKIWYTPEIFKDKLLTDSKTGDLNITNMKIKYSGLYEVEINSATGTSSKRFNITVNESPRVNNAGMIVVKSVSVNEGESVTLQTDVKLQTDDLILWRFGDESVLIAKGDMEDNKTSVYDDADGSFRDRLKLNDQTGDLIITDCKSKHSGVYQLKISSNKQTLYKTFSVIVRESGLLLGVIAGLCVFFLLIIAAVIAAGLIKISKLKHKLKSVSVKGDQAAEGSQILQKPQKSDEQKGFVQSRVKEAERRDDEIKEDVDVIDEVKSVSVKGDEADVVVIDEVKSISVKGDQAAEAQQNLQKLLKSATVASLCTPKEKVTNKVDENNQKQQNSYVAVIDKVSASVKGDQAVTDKVDKKCLKQQDSVCADVINEEMIRTGKVGGSVTLDTCVTEIKGDDEILWMFEDMTIAEYTGGKDKPLDKTDERFKGRLEMNNQTGNLTIKNFTSEYSGVYKVKIKNSSENKERKFIVAYSVLAVKGGSFTTYTKFKINEGDVVEWTSKDKITLVTGMNGDDSKTSYTDDERFRDRLKMKPETGDFTITDIRQTDEGVYTLKLINTDGKITYRILNLDVIVKGLGNIQKQQNSVRDRIAKLEESVSSHTQTQRDDEIGETTSMLGDPGDSADISNKSVAVEMKPLLDKAADRSSTSPMHSSLNQPQGPQTQTDSGWRSKSFNTTSRFLPSP